MIRFLHLADLHLGATPAYLGDLAPERAKDFLLSFERAVNFAAKEDNRIHAVLIAGDFFDSCSPPDDVLQFAVRQLQRLKSAKIPVVVMPGNHDGIAMPGSIYADKKNPIHAVAHIVDLPNPGHCLSLQLQHSTLHVYGMAWTPTLSKPPFDQFRSTGEEGFHVAILHGSLEGGRFGEQHSRDVPLKLENLAKSGMDYIALGHYHKCQMMEAGKLPVVYPGSMEGKRFSAGEIGERSFTVVTLNQGDSAKVETHPSNSRTLRMESLDLDAEDVQSDEELAALIAEKFADPNVLMRLTLIGVPAFTLDPDRLAERLRGDFFWFDLIDETDIFDSKLTEDWANENTIRGLVVRQLRESAEAARNEDERKNIELALRLSVQAFDRSGNG